LSAEPLPAEWADPETGENWAAQPRVRELKTVLISELKKE